MQRSDLNIFERYQCKQPINELYSGVQFNLVNPTSQECSFNLFQGWGSLTQIPNTPYGYVFNPSQTAFSPTYFPPAAASYPDEECATVNLDERPTIGVCYVSTSNRIYVGVEGGVVVINPVTNTIATNINLTITGQITQLVYNPTEDVVYAMDQSEMISVIDCGSQSETTLIAQPFPLVQMSYSVSNNKLYVTADTFVCYFDCSTNNLDGLIQFSDLLVGIVTWTDSLNNSYGMAFAPNTTLPNGSNVLYFDTTTNLAISSFRVPTIKTDCVQCYNSVKNTVYYVDSSNNAKEIDASTQTSLSTTIALDSPSDFCYVSTYDIIYSPFGSGNTVAVINCQTNLVEINVPTSITGAASVGKAAYNPVGGNTWITGTGGSGLVSKLCSSAPDPVCYITGSTDYNEFLQDQSSCPKCIRQIVMFCDSADQVNTPVEILSKSGTGKECSHFRFPNSTLTTDQFQSHVATLDFSDCKELVLDNVTYLNTYTIKPNSTVKMVIWYKELCTTEVFSNKKTMCKRFDLNADDANSRTEGDLCFQMPRPKKRPYWLKDFRDNPKIQNTDGMCEFEELGRPIIINTLSTHYITPEQLDKARPVEPPPLKFKGCKDTLFRPLKLPPPEFVTEQQIADNTPAVNNEVIKMPSFDFDKLGHPIINEIKKKFISAKELQAKRPVSKYNKIDVLDVNQIAHPANSTEKYYSGALNDFGIFESEKEVKVVRKIKGAKKRVKPNKLNGKTR